MPKPDNRGYKRISESMFSGVSNMDVQLNRIHSNTENLLERVFERNNMMKAYWKVVANRGSAGIDDMTEHELGEHLRNHWPVIRRALLVGRYIPQKVLRVEIPKPGGKGVCCLDFKIYHIKKSLPFNLNIASIKK